VDTSVFIQHGVGKESGCAEARSFGGFEQELFEGLALAENAQPQSVLPPLATCAKLGALSSAHPIARG